MGVKERRTKILLLLFLLSDINFEFVPFDKKAQKIADLAPNQKTKTTFSNLVNEGLIETKPAEGEGDAKYRLTEKGFHVLALSFPYVRFLKDKWDKKWRILSYEIPESKRDLRDRLRREVAGWGLGPWHRSFWVTPHPIIGNLRELISAKEEEKYVQAFEAEHVVGDRELFLEKVWGKSKLDAKYRQLFKKWHLVLSQNEDKLDKLNKVVTDYVGLMKEDPGLPPDIIGEDWAGFEAFAIYKEIRNILLS